jgi:hypothetical protein
MDDFLRLVSLRQRRADRATLEEQRAAEACKVARTRVADAREEAHLFAQETNNLEYELLLDLVNKPITVEHMQDIERRLEEAQAKADALLQILDTARSDLSLAETYVEKQRIARRQAHGKLNRISELNAILQTEERKCAQDKEDAEIDAFVETMPLQVGGTRP